MFFRFYVYADREEDAFIIYNNCMNPVMDHVVEIQELKTEPYWKFSDMYVIELSVTLNIKKDMFGTFLESISDDWEQFGKPVDELLASEKRPTCMYIKDKVSMINIYFEECELHLVPELREKRYDYHSIKEINSQGIYFDDGYFMDFELCRSNWAEKNNVDKEDTHCVAIRNILGEFPLFLFYADERVIIYFRKRTFSRWHKHFHELRFTIEKMGYRTFDMT